jgi:hypothetical protein
VLLPVSLLSLQASRATLMAVADVKIMCLGDGEQHLPLALVVLQLISMPRCFYINLVSSPFDACSILLPALNIRVNPLINTVSAPLARWSSQRGLYMGYRPFYRPT